MSDKDKIKLLRSDLYFEREENKRLRSELIKAKSDNDSHRVWISSKMEWYLDLLKDGKTPCLKWLIKDVSIQLGARFYGESVTDHRRNGR